MAAGSNRRTFLKTALGGAAGASFSFSVFETALARPAASGLAVTRLDEDMLLIAGAGGNVVAARDSAGILLVDGGVKQHSEELLELVSSELSASRIHTLFNTHWHPEQTGSNERLGKAGAIIVAHENTRLWLRAQSPLPHYAVASDPASSRAEGDGWMKREEIATYGPLPPLACPSETIYITGSRSFGNETIEYGHLLQAHTDGDIYVSFPERNLLVAGGAVCGEGWPLIDWRTGGWIGGMINGLRTLIDSSDAQTRIVPANGPLLTRSDLEERREMYATIFGRLQKMLRSGLSPAEAVQAAPAGEFEPKYGDAKLFVTLAFQSLWGHFAPDA